LYTGYLLVFGVLLAVSAAYYAGSRMLAPGSRGGEAREPYACGEQGRPLGRADPPYPGLMLLFAAVESVPVAALVAARTGPLPAAALLCTALAAVAAAGEVVGRGRR
jgi:NADH:ubiquinone oxidoreductase subunit 3 (subunit A)